MHSITTTPGLPSRSMGAAIKRTIRRVGVASLIVCGCVAMALTTAGTAAAQSPRIVGGEPAATGTWPYAVRIVVTTPTETGTCTGSVVAPNVVLTAAHCVADLDTMTLWPTSDYTVTTGTVDLSANAGQISGVSEVVADPSFVKYTSGSGSESSDYDAALLQLSSPTSAPSLTLTSPSTDASIYDAGTAAAVAGWGLTVGGGDVLPDNLQWATTVVQSQSYCEAVAAEKFDAPFDAADQMCAIDAPSDTVSTCAGDSGGPLLAVDPSGNLVEIGLTTLGQADCDTSDPDFFTNVAALSGWLTNEITELSPPAVTTLAASNVTKSSATLNGTVNPNDHVTAYEFEYGPTAKYVSGTRFENTANTGDAALPVSAHITGLKAGETIHYRLVAFSNNGTSNSPDRTFKTLTAPEPKAGTYRGKTSQHQKISLKVANNKAQIPSMFFGFRVRCTRYHRAVHYTLKPGGRGWPLRLKRGLDLDSTFPDSERWRYTFKATFKTTGTVAGTFTVTGKDPRYGRCKSGTVHWSAKV
jgi:secreted trypsin-like serine protease